MDWIAGTIEDIQNIGNWFIVDIGFSSDKKSCGIVKVENNEIVKNESNENGVEINYSAMIKDFIDFAKGKSKIGLVIEAPLSIAFNNSNPVGRKKIEIETDEDTKKSRYRYWYTGAGAAVTLATINFLYEIKNELDNLEIYLFEGLVSFKPKKPEQFHLDDAIDLYKAIQSIQNSFKESDYCSILSEEQSGTNLKFIGNYSGISLKNAQIPSVIKVNSKTSNSFHTFPMRQVK